MTRLLVLAAGVLRQDGICRGFAGVGPVEPHTEVADHARVYDLVDARIEQLERAIRETAEQEPWRACARELAGFVWAIATDQPLRSL